MLPTSGSLRHEEMSDLVSFAVNAWLCWNGHVERYAFGRVALERLDVRELCLLGGFAAQRCPNESTPVSVGARRALEEELQTARTIRRALNLDAGNAAMLRATLSEKIRDEAFRTAPVEHLPKCSQHHMKH